MMKPLQRIDVNSEVLAYQIAKQP
uniref:Uncharacterized protein n=1 Tax=Anguilla anguilla TaxID=7936 RepID=A0A0E9TTW7_ANGAN